MYLHQTLGYNVCIGRFLSSSVGGLFFNDGDKRTSLAVALAFLGDNGFTLGRLPEEVLYEFVVGISSSQDCSKMVINCTAAWLETLAQTN